MNIALVQRPVTETRFLTPAFGWWPPGMARPISVHQNQFSFPVRFNHLTGATLSSPLTRCYFRIGKRPRASPAATNSHPGQDALLYGGIELPEPLSLTEVTEQMTPTGDLEIDFITPHASVILPGLPRSLTGPRKGPG